MPITFYSNPDDIEKRKMRERRDLEKFYRDLAYDPNQPRVPKGSGETGGEWTGKGTKMITVYRGSKSDETVSSGKFSFFTEDIEYAKKYGERLSSKVIDKSKLLDARTDEGKRIIELIRNKKAEQIFLDPNTGAFFYSDLSMIENYLTDLGINKDYEGYVLSEQTLMGTGGISYAIRNSKGFPRDLAYNPDQPRDPKGSATGGEWTGSGKPNWAGDKTIEKDGYILHNGRFGLTKDKWAVENIDGDNGPWRDMPEQAISDYEKLRDAAIENRNAIQVRKMTIEKLAKENREPTLSEIRTITNGYPNFSTSSAIGVLREAGYTRAEAEKIINSNRIGQLGITSGGAYLFSGRDVVMAMLEKIRIAQGSPSKYNV